MNKKVVGGKHNVLINYMMDASALNSSGAVLCNPFKWDILWFILIENLVICVPTTLAKLILFHNHPNKKVVGGKQNLLLLHYVDASAINLFCALYSATLSNEIFCCVYTYILKIPKMCGVCEPTLWDTSRLTKLRNIKILHPIGQL